MVKLISWNISQPVPHSLWIMLRTMDELTHRLSKYMTLPCRVMFQLWELERQRWASSNRTKQKYKAITYWRIPIVSLTVHTTWQPLPVLPPITIHWADWMVPANREWDSLSPTIRTNGSSVSEMQPLPPTAVRNGNEQPYPCWHVSFTITKGNTCSTVRSVGMAPPPFHIQATNGRISTR